MSTPAAIRDAIVTKITTLYPDKTRLVRPRVIDQNNKQLLDDGYGIYIGPTQLGDVDLGIHLSVKSTDILVILTKKIYTLENDFSGEATAENDLCNEKELVIRDVADIKSEGVDSSLVDLRYIGDDGGEYIFGEKNNYLALTMTFSLLYQKDKTYCN